MKMRMPTRRPRMHMPAPDPQGTRAMAPVGASMTAGSPMTNPDMMEQQRGAVGQMAPPRLGSLKKLRMMMQKRGPGYPNDRY